MSKHYELLNQAIQAFKETCEYVEGMEDGQILGILAKGQFFNDEGQLELMVAEVTEQEELPREKKKKKIPTEEKSLCESL